MGILIKEIYIDLDQNLHCGDSGVYETRFAKKGELYRYLQKEYGRCTGTVYIDRLNGKSKAIGWVFEKRMQYEDTGRCGRPAEYYIREVWVEIHKRMPKKTVKNYY